MVLGIQTVDTGVFGGILLGLLTAFVYDLSLIHIFFRKNKKKLTSPVSFFLCWVHWPAAGTQSSSTVCRLSLIHI